MRMILRRRVIPGLLATFLVTLTACGGAKSNTEPAATSAPKPSPAMTPAPATTPALITAPEPLKLTVTLQDFSFEPKEITAVKGQKIILTLKNGGEKNHDLILQGAYDGLKSERVAPGAEGTFEFTADKAGTFEFICDLRGHKDRGMIGKLTVQEK